MFIFKEINTVAKMLKMPSHMYLVWGQGDRGRLAKAVTL